MRFVFLHGGPGFNSFSEQAIIGPIFPSLGHEIAFWNEPSRLRPEGERFEDSLAFTRWLASAKSYVLGCANPNAVHLIAHSFSVHAALEVARRHPNSVASLVLIAPATDPFACFCNVLRVAHEDLASVKPDIAATISACLGRTGAVLDDAMREGMLNVLHDDRLFTHYWADPAQLEASMVARARPEGQFDGESFFAVLTEFGQGGAAVLSTAPVTVPTLTLFGALDRITPVAEQRAATMLAAPGTRTEVLDGCSHYLHLDRPKYFVELVVDWAAAHSTYPTAIRSNCS